MLKPKPVEGRNTDPSPVTYEIQHFPSLAQQRAIVAMEAEGLNVEELREAAEEVHIDVSDARSKKDLVEAVKDGARTVIPAAESTPKTKG